MVRLCQCCFCFQQSDGTRKSDVVSKYLHKLLLLGSGESGKSTFLKQMQIIHEGEFPTERRMTFRSAIIGNIFDAISALIDAHEKLNVDYESEETRDKAKLLLENCRRDELSDPSVVDLIEEVWNCPSSQYLYRRRNEFQLADSAKYYLTKLRRIAAPGYIPTQQDVLRVRVPTTSINTYRMESNGVNFELTDVGGQRGERRKWIHLFDNVIAILFLVSMSEYDQVLYENEHHNRLRESRALFQALCLYACFEGKSIVIFFNKQDILMEKVLHSSISQYFPEFRGDPTNYVDVQQFIRDMFDVRTRPVYSHFTCATDTHQIAVLFEAVRDTILNEYLREIGLQ